MRFPSDPRSAPAWWLPPKPQRCELAAHLALTRILLSIVRRRIPTLRVPVVTLSQGPRIRADLGSATGKRLYRYGVCELALQVTQRLLRPGDVFIDGGANIGIYTVVAAFAVGPSGRVLACEPATATFNLLCDNVQLNDFTWVELCRAALADEAGEATLFTFGGGAGVSSLAPEHLEGSSQEAVRVTTLDKLVSEHTDPVRLVKLDIEGAEVKALRGATALLHGAQPHFIVEAEPDHLARQGTSLSELQSIFTEAGYVGFALSRCSRGRPSALPLRLPWSQPQGEPNILVTGRVDEVLSALCQ